MDERERTYHIQSWEEATVCLDHHAPPEDYCKCGHYKLFHWEKCNVYRCNCRKSYKEAFKKEYERKVKETEEK